MQSCCCVVFCPFVRVYQVDVQRGTPAGNLARLRGPPMETAFGQARSFALGVQETVWGKFSGNTVTVDCAAA